MKIILFWNAAFFYATIGLAQVGGEFDKRRIQFKEIIKLPTF